MINLETWLTVLGIILGLGGIAGMFVKFLIKPILEIQKDIMVIKIYIEGQDEKNECFECELNKLKEFRGEINLDVQLIKQKLELE